MQGWRSAPLAAPKATTYQRIFYKEIPEKGVLFDISNAIIDAVTKAGSPINPNYYRLKVST